MLVYIVMPRSHKLVQIEGQTYERNISSQQSSHEAWTTNHWHNIILVVVSQYTCVVQAGLTLTVKHYQYQQLFCYYLAPSGLSLFLFRSSISLLAMFICRFCRTFANQIALHKHPYFRCLMDSILSVSYWAGTIPLSQPRSFLLVLRWCRKRRQILLTI